MWNFWFLEYIICTIISILFIRIFFFIYPEPFFQHVFIRTQRPLFISDVNLFASIYIYRGGFIIIYIFFVFFFLGLGVFLISVFILKEFQKYIKLILYFFYIQILSILITDFDLAYVNIDRLNSDLNHKYWWTVFERGDAVSYREQYFGILYDLFFYFSFVYVIIICEWEFSWFNNWFIYEHYNFDVNIICIYNGLQKYLNFFWIYRIFNVIPLFYFFGGEGVFSDQYLFIYSFIFIEINIILIRFFIFIKLYIK